MKSYDVQYTSEAAENISDLFEYILAQSQNYITATRYIDRLYQRCEAIGDAPLAGASRGDISSGTRLTVFERKVVILYRIADDEVWITNIFSGGQDYETMLRRADTRD